MKGIKIFRFRDTLPAHELSAFPVLRKLLRKVV